MAGPVLLFVKAHNKGYFRGGKFVGPFDDKRPSATPKPAPAAPPAGPQGVFPGPGDAQGVEQSPLPGKPHQKSFWTGHRPLPKSAVAHPQKGSKGERVMIHYPHKPSEPATWSDPEAIATFTPGCALPDEINGIPLASWPDVPQSPEAWDYVDGQNEALEEPGMDLPHGLVPASGVIVLEPDGRVWAVAPTNRFGGTKHTFPKGQRDYGLSLQANAIKECYEETGLKVEIDSFLGDIKRSTSVARYYLARRVGGTPADMGWESQAVQLVPASKLADFLDRGDDKKVAAWLEGLA
jgi:ADP-ribose pyrophosphatase YjhB (NUDIX family)